MLAGGLGSGFAILGMMAFAQPAENWFETIVNLYWNGDYEQTLQELALLPMDELSDGEKLEVHKYRAFSYIALGETELALGELTTLLSTDPGYRLDSSLVSPKIIEQFDAARKALAGRWFEQGKSAYYSKDFGLAVDFMDRILRLEPVHELAGEYRQLAVEQMSLNEKLTSLEAQDREPQEAPEPAEEPEDKIYQPGGEVTAPLLLNRIVPQYPRVDAQRGRQGQVVLLILIGKDGSVEQARVIKAASSSLGEAALGAVRQWRYRPALLNGKPVRVSWVVGIDFEITER